MATVGYFPTGGTLTRYVGSSWLSGLAARVEFGAAVTLARSLGIEAGIRYLRNPHPWVTVRLLKAFGARIGERTTFKGRVYVDNAYQDQDSRGDFSNLVIGDSCYVGDGVYFDLAGRIEIGDGVVISAGASFVTHADCNRSPFLDQAFPRRCEAVRVGHGAWIGLRATLLAGACVGERTLLAAHSLLLDTAEAESLYVGAPARKARSLRP